MVLGAPTPRTVLGSLREPAAPSFGPWLYGPRLSPTESADHKLITQEALDLLQAVRDGQPVSRDRAEQFARAVLELHPVGRLALGVLDGGLFTGTRLVELADLVLSAEGETASIEEVEA